MKFFSKNIWDILSKAFFKKPDILETFHKSMEDECPRILSQIQSKSPNLEEIEMGTICLSGIRFPQELVGTLYILYREMEKYSDRIVSVEWRRFENLSSMGRFVLTVYKK